MTKGEAINDFLSQREFAIYGVSRKGSKFGNAILREMRKKGYKLYPIHPEAVTLENEKCYKSIHEVPFPLDGVILNIPPAETEKVVVDIHAAGINRIWMQQGSSSGQAIEYCNMKGINFIAGECIMMFTEPIAFFHRAHKWIWGVLGKLPA
jgi:hypothetical protein